MQRTASEFVNYIVLIQIIHYKKSFSEAKTTNAENQSSSIVDLRRSLTILTRLIARSALQLVTAKDAKFLYIFMCS